MTSWPVLGLEEHTLSTGYRGRWGWRGGTTHVGSVTLPCSALLERTASLRPPHLWLPGRLGHCETPEEDGRSGRGVVGVRALCSAPRGISAGSHVPTEAPAPSPRRWGGPISQSSPVASSSVAHSCSLVKHPLLAIFQSSFSLAFPAPLNSPSHKIHF